MEAAQRTTADSLLADKKYLRGSDRRVFQDAPLSQEYPWASWFLAAAAKLTIQLHDSEQTHMTLPTISQKLLLFLEKDTLANFLLEREQTLVNTLLLRYRNIAEMAPLPDDDDIKEVTAAQTFQLKVETAALIRAAEDLMSLTRELKELWLFGPLRGLNEGEAEANAKIEEDSKEVAKLVDSLVKKEGGDEKA